MNKCQAEFAALSKAVEAEPKVFCMTYGTKYFDWDILDDQEHHFDTVFKPPTSYNVVSSSFDCDAPLKNYFLNIFPSVKGHTLLLTNIWQTQGLCFFMV